MQYKLVIVSGPAKKKEVVIQPPVVLGRSREADITLGHPLVSRRHCEIRMADDGTLVVEDLGSLNGTYHGEDRISDAVSLQPGELLTVGSVTFRAQYGEGAPAAESAPDESAQVLPDFSDVAPEESAELDAEFDPFGEDGEEEDSANFDTPSPDFAEEASDGEKSEEESEELDEFVPVDEVDEGEVVEEVEADEAGEPAAEAEENSNGSGLGWLSSEEPAASSASDSNKASSDEDLEDFFKGL